MMAVISNFSQRDAFEQKSTKNGKTYYDPDFECDLEIELLLELVPYIKGLLGEDIGIYISNLQEYIYCSPGKVNIKLKTMDPVKENSIVSSTVKSGKRTVNYIKDEVYGAAYIGIGYPILNPHGKIIGCLCMVAPSNHQELILTTGKTKINIDSTHQAVINFYNTANELTVIAKKLNNKIQNIKIKANGTEDLISLLQEIFDRTCTLDIKATDEEIKACEYKVYTNRMSTEPTQPVPNIHQSIENYTLILLNIKECISKLSKSIDRILANGEH